MDKDTVGGLPVPLTRYFPRFTGIKYFLNELEIYEFCTTFSKVCLLIRIHSFLYAIAARKILAGV